MPIIISDKLLRDYLRIDATLGTEKESTLRAVIRKEEKTRDKFREKVFSLTPFEMIDLTQRVLDISKKLLKNSRVFGSKILSLLGSTVGLRYSTKFLQKHPKYAEKHEIISYSEKEEGELKKLLLPLQKKIPYCELSELSSLIWRITGKYIHFESP